MSHTAALRGWQRSPFLEMVERAREVRQKYDGDEEFLAEYNQLLRTKAVAEFKRFWPLLCIQHMCFFPLKVHWKKRATPSGEVAFYPCYQNGAGAVEIGLFAREKVLNPNFDILYILKDGKFRIAFKYVSVLCIGNQSTSAHVGEIEQYELPDADATMECIRQQLTYDASLKYSNWRPLLRACYNVLSLDLLPLSPELIDIVACYLV